METHVLQVRLRDPQRGLEALRLIAQLLPTVPRITGPARLSAEVESAGRAVDVLIELAWSGIELTDFSLDRSPHLSRPADRLSVPARRL